MAVIRQIIAPGALAEILKRLPFPAGLCVLWWFGAVLLAVCGCGPRYDFQGDWIGDRGVNVPKGQETPADTTLNRITLKVDQDGKFTLVDRSVPFEGKLDFYSKTQKLSADYIMGRPANRTGMARDYTLTWDGDGRLELLEPPGPAFVLHRK